MSWMRDQLAACAEVARASGIVIVVAQQPRSPWIFVDYLDRLTRAPAGAGPQTPAGEARTAHRGTQEASKTTPP